MVETRQSNRRRSSSITQALSVIPPNNIPFAPQRYIEETNVELPSHPSLQLNGSADNYTAAQKVADESQASSLRNRQPKNGDVTASPKAAVKKSKLTTKNPFDDARYRSDGFFTDLRTGKWMLIPASSIKILAVPILLYLNHKYILTNPQFPLPTAIRQAIPTSTPNIWAYFLTMSGFDGYNEIGQSMYKRNWMDSAFLCYYIVFFCFFRQSVILYLLRPLGDKLGVAPGKIERFTEQGYAITYWGLASALGIYVMKDLPVWWYNTAAFFNTFPTLQMTAVLKAYYLLQTSYWLQQIILLAARVEKPRKDYKELVAHHIVTLWMVIWSYIFTMTYIGVAIFVTMDISDVFLALAKCVNYVNEDRSAPVFAVFVVVWTYFRHYLNIKILWSVWNEWDLIPERLRIDFNLFTEEPHLPNWIKQQCFYAILLLQFLNLFWYFLILRILYKAVFGTPLADDRSDGEEEEAEAVTDLKAE